MTDIDHAITHHSAIEEDIPGWDKPITNVKCKKPRFAGALDLAFEVWVPPDMIDVEGDTSTLAKLITQIIRLSQRVHTGPFGAMHRMQWLNGQRDPARQSVGQDRSQPIPGKRPSAVKVT